MRGAFVLGVDLAGPANREGTAAALFRVAGEGLEHRCSRGGLGDGELLALLAAEAPGPGRLVAGLDAPLSYNPGGGDRPGDRALRRRLAGAGLAAGTVMAPTMTRMVHLTLRGVAVARLLSSVYSGCRIAEVHPAGAMALRGAPVGAVRELKRSGGGRRALREWLGEQGLAGLPPGPAGDHQVAAWAAALAAWRWQGGGAAWLHRAAPPLHPFDLAC